MGLERMLNEDDNKKLIKQVAVGSVSGWICGFVSCKVGKVMGAVAGGGLIVLIIANNKGYININWNRLSKDVDKVKSRLEEEATGKKQWTDKLEKKLEKKTTDLISKQRNFFHSILGTENDNDKVIKDVAIFSGSFVLGFGLGVLTGQ